VPFRTFPGLTVGAVALVLTMPVYGQNPSPTTQAQVQVPVSQAPQPLGSPVEGEVVSIDATGKKITIKPLTGAEVVFTYTDKTEISGAQQDAAGLATVEQARVTVHYSEDAESKVKTAIRIVVESKK
jgi:hypothetical protein